jgi:hypothetical protein
MVYHMQGYRLWQPVGWQSSGRKHLPVLNVIVALALWHFHHVRIWAISLVIITSPLLFTLKPRIPLSAATTRRPLDWRFLKITFFWMLQLGSICQALGYLLPTTYLASYAHDLGLPSLTGAVLIAVCSLASVLGSFVTGFVNDKLTPTTVIFVLAGFYICRPHILGS